MFPPVCHTFPYCVYIYHATSSIFSLLFFEGVLVLLVSDRPNGFLCHYLLSAMLNGLHPTVLGWNARSWRAIAGTRRPGWHFHLGAKVVLPLHYLRECKYAPETLLVFTDHDVFWQGGYADIKGAYKAASAAKGANPKTLLFFLKKKRLSLFKT